MAAWVRGKPNSPAKRKRIAGRILAAVQSRPGYGYNYYDNGAGRPLPIDCQCHKNTERKQAAQEEKRPLCFATWPGQSRGKNALQPQQNDEKAARCLGEDIIKLPRPSQRGQSEDEKYASYGYGYYSSDKSRQRRDLPRPILLSGSEHPAILALHGKLKLWTMDFMEHLFRIEDRSLKSDLWVEKSETKFRFFIRHV